MKTATPTAVRLRFVFVLFLVALASAVFAGWLRHHHISSSFAGLLTIGAIFLIILQQRQNAR